MNDELRAAALAQVAENPELTELVRRCFDEGDCVACAELDQRGVEPPVVELGPEPKVASFASRARAPSRSG